MCCRHCTHCTTGDFEDPLRSPRYEIVKGFTAQQGGQRGIATELDNLAIGWNPMDLHNLYEADSVLRLWELLDQIRISLTIFLGSRTRSSSHDFSMEEERIHRKIVLA